MRRENGHNQFGLDKDERDKKYYAEKIKRFRRRLDEAYQQLQQGKLRYALYDANIVMRETVKMLLQYANGREEGCDNLLKNMKICEREHLFGRKRKFVKNLYEVYCVCECAAREFSLSEHINHNEVYFVIMQIKDLLNWAEKTIVTG